MTVHVEFFGIPRKLTGVASVNLQAETLLEVLNQLHRLYPEFGLTCLDHNTLKPGFIININGTTFTKASHHRLNYDDDILILSSDAGG